MLSYNLLGQASTIILHRRDLLKVRLSPFPPQAPENWIDNTRMCAKVTARYAIPRTLQVSCLRQGHFYPLHS